MRLCAAGICVLGHGHHMHAPGDGEVLGPTMDIDERSLQQIGSGMMFTANVLRISCTAMVRRNARILFRACAAAVHVLQRAHVARQHNRAGQLVDMARVEWQTAATLTMLKTEPESAPTTQDVRTEEPDCKPH